jgi:hypothetical protein
MRAITTRRDPMKTQGVLILNLFLYAFLTGAAFAQNREVTPITYPQKVRAFYTGGEFARITKGKVNFIAQPSVRATTSGRWNPFYPPGRSKSALERVISLLIGSARIRGRYAMIFHFVLD